MKRLASGFLALLLLLTCTSCAPQAPSVTQTSFKLDTVVTITLYDWSEEETITRAMKEIDRLEALLSVEKEGSDLYRLAEQAGKSWVEIAPETQAVLQLAKNYAALSQGHFDVTTGPLIDLWNIRDGKGHYPSEGELAQTLPLVSSEQLLLEDGRAYLTQLGMKANLGAIAKGYIADQIKTFLTQEGVEHAVIDLGRNILLLGGKPDGNDFRIGVQSPFEAEGKTLDLTLHATDKSIVTSGVYERFFEYQGKRYHHILDPFTGFPADRGLAAVTILSDRSADGDALSTICLLLGVDSGLELIETLPGVEALFIRSDGEAVMSSGFSAWVD